MREDDRRDGVNVKLRMTFTPSLVSTFRQACWMFGCRRSLCIAKEKNYFFSFASYVMVTLALTQIFAARMTVAASSACSVIMPLAEKLLAPLS